MYISPLIITSLTLSLAIKGVHFHILTENEGKIDAGEFLKIITKQEWQAKSITNNLETLNLPVSQVVVTSTNSYGCAVQAVCESNCRFLQIYHIEAYKFDDIAYNFLIGGDGNIYEGRGWDHIGASQDFNNNDRIIIGYIGTFKEQPLTEKHLSSTKMLLDEGVRLGKLKSDYKIIGNVRIEPIATTSTPDVALYDCFKRWEQWTD